jgi:hypothetical protein
LAGIFALTGNNILAESGGKEQDSRESCDLAPPILSVQDVMRKFNVWSLAMLLHHINRTRESLRKYAEDKEGCDDSMGQENSNELLEGTLMTAQTIAMEINLQSAYDRVWRGGGPFWLKAKTNITWREAYDELRVLRECIEADLETKWFAFLLPDKVKFMTESTKDWKLVIQAIPDAEQDIREALYCYALERDTGAVFHSMRVAEWGLRAFCHHLGFRKIKSRIKKSGKLEFTPIEYSNWEQILNQLRPKVNERLEKLKRGKTKQSRQEFYNPILSDIEAFKDAWRNHVMHTRRDFSSDDAKAIIGHVKRFMMLLVSNGVAKFEAT